MKFLPISINLSNQQILVIGGGKVALHKIQLLKRFTDHFKVIAPEILDDIKVIEGVEYIERKFQNEDLQGHLWVYVTTNDHELNHRISDKAKSYNCLVNIADDSNYSDFVSPAIMINDNMTVAVGSDGKNVKASIQLRNQIKLFLEE